MSMCLAHSPAGCSPGIHPFQGLSTKASAGYSPSNPLTRFEAAASRQQRRASESVSLSPATTDRRQAAGRSRQPS
jgi:hypothetical protein